MSTSACALLQLFALHAGVATATLGYGTVMSQDPLPPCQTRVLCNGEFCADTCVDGTVLVDPWLRSTVLFQYDLVADRSWKFGPIIGTHNGFISRTNGFGLTEDLAASLYSRTGVGAAANGGGEAGALASTHVRVPNQRYGPQTLLDLGVRELEFDLWDITWDGKTFDVYMCHSPVPDPDAVVSLQEAADALALGPLTYDPFLELCSNHTLAWAAGTVLDWLQRAPNAQQFVGMFLDNRVATWNAGLVASSITSVWGSALMTPADLVSLQRQHNLSTGAWPSRTQMLSAGKRGYCETNSYVGNNYTGTPLAEACFFPTTWSASQLGDNVLQPFPNCSISGQGPNGTADASWYSSRFVRVLDSGDLAWSPEAESEGGIIYKPNGIADLVGCGYNNVGVADFSPSAAVGFVWSWAAGEPAAPSPSTHGADGAGGGCRAGAMTLVRGSWTAQPCSTLFPALCRLGDNTLPAGNQPGLWNITQGVVGWVDAPAACSALGEGWAFDVPRDGRENQLVAQAAVFAGLWQRGAGGIWLNAPVA